MKSGIGKVKQSGERINILSKLLKPIPLIILGLLVLIPCILLLMYGFLKNLKTPELWFIIKKSEVFFDCKFSCSRPALVPLALAPRLRLIFPFPSFHSGWHFVSCAILIFSQPCWLFIKSYRTKVWYNLSYYEPI